MSRGELPQRLDTTLIFKPTLHFFWIFVAQGHWRMGMRGALHGTANFLRHWKAWEKSKTQRKPCSQQNNSNEYGAPPWELPTPLSSSKGV